MIQALMLIALGFLIASLIGVLLAPSLWSRAYRLSRKRLEQTLPLTLTEIEATQDQLRAAYAVRLRRLETALANARQKAAMQLVDNSRLQMQIAALKDRIGDLDLSLSERRNAATVLEQAITKRFPELDREISALKVQLQERAYELQDLTNRLGRRDEELTGAEKAASSYQEELVRLRQALEKGSGDRSGRLLRRASQWSLDDYRAEYDRLNLDLSKLRQQLAQLQDRDAQQVSVIKGELQKLAELILSSSQPKDDRSTDRLDSTAKRIGGLSARRDPRPAPWLDPLPAPAAGSFESSKPKDSPSLPTPVPAAEQASAAVSITAGAKSDLGSASLQKPKEGTAAAVAPPGPPASGFRSTLTRDVIPEEAAEEGAANGLDQVEGEAAGKKLRANGSDREASSNEGSIVKKEKAAFGDPTGAPTIGSQGAQLEKTFADISDLQSLSEAISVGSGNGSHRAKAPEVDAKPTRVVAEETSHDAQEQDQTDGGTQSRTLLDRLRGAAADAIEAKK